MSAAPARMTLPPTTARLPLADTIKAGIAPVAYFTDRINLNNDALVAGSDGYAPKVRCPLHQDRTPSLSIHVQTGAWHCFGCKAHGGSVIDFEMALFKLSFDGARAALAKDFGIQAEEPSSTTPRRKSPTPRQTPSPAPRTPLHVVPTACAPAIPESAIAVKPNTFRGLGKPSATWCYKDVAGHPVLYVVRFDKAGSKEYRPLSWQSDPQRPGQGRWQFKDPIGTLPLYNADELARQPTAPVLIVEGERCADAAARLFPDWVTTTTCHGSSAPAKSDFSVLSGRTIRIWPDHDDPGRGYAEQVAHLATTAGAVEVRVLDLKSLAIDPQTRQPCELRQKWDAADAEQEGWSPAALTQHARWLPVASDPQVAPAPSDPAEESEEKTSQATALVAFAMARVSLFHDQNKDVFATDRATGENRRIDGRSFKDWLVSNFYTVEAKAPREQAIREALSTLSGIGRFQGEQQEVWIRVAAHGGAYYLDLAEPGQSRAVRIAADGWTLVEVPPVRFIRPESAQPLPVPLRGGNLARLWELANVPPDLRLLVAAWLGDCLRPDTPFPVLELIGEQGSAKSTTQTVLRRLIDPNACDLRGAPKLVEDVFISAGASWLVSYENVSHLPGPIQDAFCVLATGGGHAKRKLYSDADESVITVKRPLILNGIGAAITAQDLIDRTISVETPRIGRRVEVTTLWKTFRAHHAHLLGALLTAMVGALARLPTTGLPPGDPRLTEFARFGEALTAALGGCPADFHGQFQASREESIARTIDASPVASALIDWFDARSRVPIELTAKDLFAAVGEHKPLGADAWPRSAKGFGDAMRRAAPALRQLEIECRSLGKRGSNVIWIVKPAIKDSIPSRESRPSRADGHPHDPASTTLTTFTTSTETFYRDPPGMVAVTVPTIEEL